MCIQYLSLTTPSSCIRVLLLPNPNRCAIPRSHTLSFVHSLILSFLLFLSIYLSLELSRSFILSIFFVYFHFLSPVDRLNSNCYYCRAVEAGMHVWVSVLISKQQFDTILFEMKSVICYHMRSFRQTPLLLVYTVFVMRASANIYARVSVWCCSCCCIQRIQHLFRIDMLAVTKFIAKAQIIFKFPIAFGFSSANRETLN